MCSSDLFFAFLEKYTHQDIAFSQFATQGLDAVTMTADAKSYGAIAEQVQAFSSASEVRKVKVSGLTAEVSPTGLVSSVRLTLTITLAPDLIRLPAGVAKK